MSTTAPQALPPSADLASTLSRSPLVLMLDVDGTIAPIVGRPDLAAVPDDTRHAITALARSPGVHVAIVSGRSAADAARLAAVEGAWVIGNHGAEVAPPGGAMRVNPDTAKWASAVHAASEALRAPLAEIEGVILEDKRWTLSIHVRLAAPESVPRVSDLVRAAAERFGLAQTFGRKLFELRPPVAVNKGTAAVALARELGADRPEGAVAYLGDDHTDEDAFASLLALRADAVTVHVGTSVLPDGTATRAGLVLRDPAEAGEMLAWLARLRAGRK